MSPAPRNRPRWWRAPMAAALGALALAVASLALVWSGPSANAEGEHRGERPIDHVHSGAAGIQYFTDCDDGGVTADCGGAPGRWFPDAVPVSICTHHFARPSDLSAEDFRSYVRDASLKWNPQDAAAGLDYLGDCEDGFRWEDDNSVNEIGFDDSRNVVTGTAAAIARGSWFDIPFFGIPTDRRFVEFDVILDAGDIPEVCLRSVIAHELGHVLGFGHSDTRTDLMFNSFDPDDLATCPTGTSEGERDLLQTLYGVNRPPTLDVESNVVGVPGTSVTLNADASDPEGDAITYTWEQIVATPVDLVTSGSVATFDAPDQAAPLAFEVTASDRYLHLDSATVIVNLDASTTLPVLAPSFASFTAGRDELAGGAALGWSARSDASSYLFCTRMPFSGVETCNTQATPVAAMDWDTVVGTIGGEETRRVFTTGTRETSMAGCNAAGCTDGGVGPLFGGLRWPSWNMDYDYLAMAFDVPDVNIQFTIGGVTNIEGPARRFEFYVGTADDPLQERIHTCGSVAVNAVCFGLLTPADDGHLTHLTIVSSRAGTPTTEHQIRIR